MAIFKHYRNGHGTVQKVEVLRVSGEYTFCKNEKGTIFQAKTSGLKSIK